MLGFHSFRCARILLAGIELMHMLRKGQYRAPQGRRLSAADQFYSLTACSLRNPAAHFGMRSLLRQNLLKSPREHHLSGATITPRKPALSIAAWTRPSDFASSMNWRAYVTPSSRPFGSAIACGSVPGRPSRT